MDHEITDSQIITAISEYLTRNMSTWSQLADELEISRENLSRWRAGRPISPKIKKKLVGVLMPDLLEQQPQPRRPSECSFDVPPPVFVPLLTVAQAATLQVAPFGPSAPSIEDGEQSGFINAKPGDFAIVVSGRSMMPWYPPGTHILVRPGKVPQTGNRVVAMIAEDIEPIFKIYINLGERFALLSINEQEGIPPRILDKMDRTEWYWCWPIVESKRNEDDLDAAMKEFGIRHHWQEWLEEWQAEHP